ncbi:DNA polymerase IV [Spirosoma fluviale]|uniref:DNA polymerase IV n=1 Tax=Spirosoma fluviale TaxID=1597977 RepID=A0A286GUK3_9BACT|nr:DNA polymerase IV [Spirosoma fluviale]SOD99170.1 DNA polymerase-4 [Spirosoma fluviale]
MATNRILHLDMDAFYASIEQRDQPRYRGKPLIVARPAAERGVVSACSYQARAFGIHAGMPTAVAVRKCPTLVVVPPNLDLYKDVSRTIMSVLRQFTKRVEPLAFDEAYLDVSDRCPDWTSALELASTLKQTIFEWTNLTCSVGVSFNKFLAKLASCYQKPDGLTFISPTNFPLFIEQTPVTKFYGIGDVTGNTLRQMGIFTGKELMRLDEATLVRLFRKRGSVIYQCIRGIDERKVDNNRQSKSYGKEYTFAQDVNARSDELDEALRNLTILLCDRLTQNGHQTQRLLLKVRFADFNETSKRFTLEQPTDYASVIEETTKLVLQRVVRDSRKIRRIGVYALDFALPLSLNTNSQLSLL